MTTMSTEDVDLWFPDLPRAGELAGMIAIRWSARQMALAIAEHCPKNFHCRSALLSLREAVVDARDSFGEDHPHPRAHDAINIPPVVVDSRTLPIRTGT